MSPENQLKIRLLGTSLTIRADEKSEHLQRVLWCLERKIQEVSSSSSLTDPVKIALLTSFCLVDELLKEKNNGVSPSDGNLPEESREIERITLELISHIDDVIKEPQK